MPCEWKLVSKTGDSNMITARKIIEKFEWMIVDIKHRHDDLRGNLEEGSQGDYSLELKAAMTLMNELKASTQTIIGGKFIHIRGRLKHSLNCKQFKCPGNVSGDCAHERIQLRPIGSPIISHLICEEAEEKEKSEEEKRQ